MPTKKGLQSNSNKKYRNSRMGLSFNFLVGSMDDESDGSVGAVESSVGNEVGMTIGSDVGAVVEVNEVGDSNVG